MIASPDLLGSRCKFKTAGPGAGYDYKVSAVWTVVLHSGYANERPTLYCALLTDDGHTNAGYWDELEFEPLVP